MTACRKVPTSAKKQKAWCESTKHMFVKEHAKAQPSKIQNKDAVYRIASVACVLQSAAPVHISIANSFDEQRRSTLSS